MALAIEPTASAVRSRKESYAALALAIFLWALGVFLIREDPKGGLALLGLLINLVAYALTAIGVSWYTLSWVNDKSDFPWSAKLLLLAWALAPILLIVEVRDDGGWRFFVRMYDYAETHGWYVALMICALMVSYYSLRGRLKNATDKIQVFIFLQPCIFLLQLVVTGTKTPADGAPYYFAGFFVAGYLGYFLALARQIHSDRVTDK